MKGQPDNRGSSGQQCAVLRPSSGEWLDRGCSNRFRYICKTRAFGSGCSDFWDGCQTLLDTKPTFCKQYPEFALRMCPATCDICPGGVTSQCPVGSISNGKARLVDNGQKADDTLTVRQGTGFVAASGDSVRGCLLNGKMGGEPLQCIPDCPRGWTYLPSSGDCASVFTHEQLDAATAMSRCEELGGLLAMPKTETDNAALTQLVNSVSSMKTFIGLNDTVAEGDFTWNDGQPLRSNDWNSWSTNGPQPNNLGGEDCTNLRPGGKWFDSKCNAPLNYVCQASIYSAEPLVDECLIDTPPTYILTSIDLRVTSAAALGDTVQYSCADGYALASGDPVRTCLASGKLTGEMVTCTPVCPEGWSYRSENGNCYRLIDEAVKWEAARSRCRDLGASLAMPKTASETAFVVSLNPRYSIWQWIDLSDQITENEFVWGDGTPLGVSGWTFWYGNQPNNAGNEDCVFIREEGEWMDGKCTKASRRFTCQADFN